MRQSSACCCRWNVQCRHDPSRKMFNEPSQPQSTRENKGDNALKRQVREEDRCKIKRKIAWGRINETGTDHRLTESNTVKSCFHRVTNYVNNGVPPNAQTNVCSIIIITKVSYKECAVQVTTANDMGQNPSAKYRRAGRRPRRMVGGDHQCPPTPPAQAQCT